MSTENNIAEAECNICEEEALNNEFVVPEEEENESPELPSPVTTPSCDTVVLTENCPTPVTLTVEGCEDVVELNAGSINMSSLGRIIQLDVTINRVCPNRRVALAVILNEVDKCGTEHKRGLKTIEIPAHHRSGCTNVMVRCIKFVLPESLDVSSQDSGICNRRTFKARFIAHYIDHDFECCTL